MFSLKRLSFVLVLLASLLAGCQAVPPPRSAAPLPSATVRQVEMVTATPIATSTPIITATFPPAPTPTVTLTATAQPAATVTPIVAVQPSGTPTLTPPPGQVYFSHVEIPGFLFPADPNRWKKATGSNPYLFLSHQTLPDCRIDAVPGRGIGTPNRVQRWSLGRLYWFIYDYQQVALASIQRPEGLFLELHGLQDPACLEELQPVMANVLLESEVTGKTPYDPLPTATARPPLPGFDCPNTPQTRLRIGDYVHIITQDLLLRSEPRAETSTRIRTYSEGAPVFIEIIDGPVCGGKYVYWKVRLGEIGEGMPEPVTGWMAEGDRSEYYLEYGE